MSGLETAALVAVCLWLGLLSVTIVVLVRQVSLVTAWVQERSSDSQDDGLDVGERVPLSALEMIPELDKGLGYVLFFDGDCDPCRDFAAQAAGSEAFAELEDRVLVTASVTGQGEQVDSLIELLPNWVRTFRDSEARHLRDQFEVELTPNAMEVEKGNVTGQAVAGHGLVNFLNLVDARGSSNADRFAGPGSEAPELEVMQVPQTHGGE